MSNINRSREDTALVLALLRSSQLFHWAMNPVFQSAKLTSAQWDVLEILYTKGELSVNELIRLALSTSGNLDVVIKNLMQAGFVEKIVNKHDRRSRIVRLSKRGKAKVEEVMPIHNKALEQIFSGLTKSEKRGVIKSLNQLKKQFIHYHKGD